MVASLRDIGRLTAGECFDVRKARAADIPGIVPMQHASFRILGHGVYSTEQIESFLRHVPTLEEHLVADGTYYVATLGERIVGCGGWTLRMPAYESVAVEAAHGRTDVTPVVRAMYVHPDFTRRGIGRALLAVIEDAIMADDHARAELVALLPGVPLYRASGYRPVACPTAALPDGTRLPLLRMAKQLRAAVPQESAP